VRVVGPARVERVKLFINGKPHTGPLTLVYDAMHDQDHLHINLPLPEGLVLHSLDEVIRLWAKGNK
jgi:hypothetical protein